MIKAFGKNQDANINKTQEFSISTAITIVRFVLFSYDELAREYPAIVQVKSIKVDSCG